MWAALVAKATAAPLLPPPSQLPCPPSPPPPHHPHATNVPPSQSLHTNVPESQLAAAYPARSHLAETPPLQESGAVQKRGQVRRWALPRPPRHHQRPGDLPLGVGALPPRHQAPVAAAACLAYGGEGKGRRHRPPGRVAVGAGRGRLAAGHHLRRRPTKRSQRRQRRQPPLIGTQQPYATPPPPRLQRQTCRSGRSGAPSHGWACPTGRAPRRGRGPRRRRLRPRGSQRSPARGRCSFHWRGTLQWSPPRRGRSGGGWPRRWHRSSTSSGRRGRRRSS